MLSYSRYFTHSRREYLHDQSNGLYFVLVKHNEPDFYCATIHRHVTALGHIILISSAMFSTQAFVSYKQNWWSSLNKEEEVITNFLYETNACGSATEDTLLPMYDYTYIHMNLRNATLNEYKLHIYPDFPCENKHLNSAKFKTGC